MNEERLKALAKECGAITYTHRSSPHEAAVSFGPEGWAKFCAALAAQPGAEPAKNNDVDQLLRAVFELCEATEEAPEVAPKNEHQRGFERGRRFEAKAIRRAVGDWFQATFCGRSFMGEPVIAAAPTEAKPAQQDAVDAALAYLDDLKDDAIAHIWPDDLERCMTSECAVQVASVRMGSPDGMTVPLFSREQVADAIRAAISAKKVGA